MENTQRQIPARLAFFAKAVNVIAMFLVLLVPIANLFIGLKVLAGFLTAAIVQKRVLKLFVAVLASVPVGLVLTLGALMLWTGQGAGEAFDTAVLVYMFVTGPAWAGLAAALVVFWPTETADERGEKIV